jgi:hypothetical protein
MSTEDENKKKPLVRKKTSKKLKTSTAKLSALSISDTTPLQKDLQIENVIKEAFLRFYDTASVKHSKVKDLEQLDHIAEEYLNSFMILGYDINGEKVSIMHAETPHDRDALIEHLRTTLLNFLNPNER